jgi:hypothetical protein
MVLPFWVYGLGDRQYATARSFTSTVSAPAASPCPSMLHPIFIPCIASVGSRREGRCNPFTVPRGRARDLDGAPAFATFMPLSCRAAYARGACPKGSFPARKPRQPAPSDPGKLTRGWTEYARGSPSPNGGRQSRTWARSAARGTPKSSRRCAGSWSAAESSFHNEVLRSRR